ncbi:M56 family metallopeptidase [Chryseobacterium binzhouense]|uniref:M56 family metallopeptidase n=1 Tax=Chryseobacterium binzhouense TaxID=2593646 RepID=UPI00289DF8DB|nr:M56 family metallopeptidase [Chryseobacterium binzhouense]
MEIILLKTILCSGMLLGFYHIFLAKEKTFVFNRFYLLSALIFSLSIPFATIETKQIEEVTPKTVLVGEISQTILQNPAIQQESFDYLKALLVLSVLITGFLFLKLIYSVLKIKRLKGKRIIYQDRKIVLLQKDFAPFSFWDTIYLSENYFKDSKIDETIFLHENIHIMQKHTADILFIKIIKAVFWFNPFIYFYKKAIINNHEFLADEAVIAENKNIKVYQELILQEILKQQNIALIHQFNFNNTKKRFIMMTKKNSKFATTKNYLALPAFIVLAFVFAEKVYANENTKAADSKITTDTKKQSTYYSEVYQKINNDEKKGIGVTFNDNDKNDFLSHLEKDTIKPQEKNNIKAEENHKSNDSSIPAPPPPSSSFVQAEFPGGVSDIRKKAAEVFNPANIKDDKETLQSVVYISIDETGKVEKVISTGIQEDFNKEAERSVKLALGETLWKPATNAGKPVKTAFSIPISLHFEKPKKTQ